MEPFTLILAALLAQTSADALPPAPPPPPPRATMQADIDGDGLVTRDEALAQADAQFATMDADHDGRLSAEERRAGMAAMRASRPGSGDGLRPPREGSRPRGAAGAMAGGDMTQAAFRDRAGQRFDRLDTDRDGKVDRAEMAAARAAMRGDGRPRPAGDE